MTARICSAALLLAIACSAAAGAAAAPAPSPASCPSLLTLVDQLPEASLFAELLIALGAADKPIPQLSDPLPPAERRRLLARRELAACPAVYQPVCSTEGETFSNACVAGTRGASVACQGECPCKDAKPCPAIYMPVCGVDGVTYGNECVAEANRTTAACEGECPCEPDVGPCPMNYDPVCGVDGFTYSNVCLAGPTPLACEGPCPCPGSGEVVPATAAGDSVICIEDIVDPVCGVDRKNYTSGCLAAKQGVEAACKGLCPCPDLIDALQGGGGMLLVPTDDSLLNVTALLPGGFNDTAALRSLLSRHTLLTQSQPGKVPPKPSETGAGALTEALQRVRLYSATKQQAGRVLPLGFSGDGPIEVIDIAVGCGIIVQQIAEPLLGLPQPA